MPNRSSKTENKEKFQISGSVLEALPNTRFRVQLETGKTIQAYVTGKIRINRIRIVPGDTVQVELSPYDLTQGRIVYREK